LIIIVEYYIAILLISAIIGPALKEALIIQAIAPAIARCQRQLLPPDADIT